MCVLKSVKSQEDGLVQINMKKSSVVFPPTVSLF